MRNTMITRPDTGVRMAQRGFTLVELMVAMTIGLLVAAAAVATLLVGRQGFNTVDSSTQLRETARFAANAIESASVLAGFQNEAYGVETASRPPGIRGYTNALVSAAGANLPNGLAHNTRTATNCGAATGTACLNGSDVLVVNFWGASRNGSPDGTMIDCGGAAEPEGPGPGPTAYSIIHVATASTGEVNQEPSLACSYKDPLTGTFKTVPIVRGVESFPGALRHLRCHAERLLDGAFDDRLRSGNRGGHVSDGSADGRRRHLLRQQLGPGAQLAHRLAGARAGRQRADRDRGQLEPARRAQRPQFHQPERRLVHAEHGGGFARAAAACFHGALAQPAKLT